MTATKLLIVLAVIAIVATGASLGLSQFDRLRTEVAITDFWASPSETGARTLVELVDDQAATPKQVERILPLLLTPKVTKERTYPLEVIPKIQVELPYEVTFKNLIADIDEYVWIDGESQYGTGTHGVRTLRREPSVLQFYPTPERPGTYTMEIRYTYRLMPHRKRVWRWKPSEDILIPQRQFVELPESADRKTKYECHINVPVEIVMVDTRNARKPRSHAGKSQTLNPKP